MPEGVGLLNFVSPPFLDRIAKEERLGQDHPRKPRDQSTELAGEKGNKTNPPDGDLSGQAPASSQHIDLRI